jgi:hypothetical protein
MSQNDVEIYERRSILCKNTRARRKSFVISRVCIRIFYWGRRRRLLLAGEARYIKGSSPRRRWRRRRLPPLSGDDFFRLPPNPDLNTFDKVGPLRRSDQEAINDEA